MTTAQTARQPILTAVSDRLKTLGAARLTVHVGEVIGTPKVLPNVDRVAPYAVVHSNPGRPDLNPSLEAAPSDLLWSGQVTFVAGLLDDLMALLDDAVPLLNLWVPFIAGIECGALRPPDGFVAVTRKDDNARPPRWMAPTLWQLHTA